MDSTATRQIEETAAALAAMAEGKSFGIDEYARRFLSGASLGGGGSLGGPSNPFAQSLWVNACITAISTNAARVPVRLSRTEAAGTRAVFGLKAVRWGPRHARKINRSEKGYLKAREGEIVESGDLYNLLTRPNPEQTWNEFIETTVGLLYCYGRVHWLFDEMAGRRVISMYAIGGGATKPVPDKSGKIARLLGWKFRKPRGGWVDVTLDETITFQMFNPDDPHAGLAPKVPARLAIVSDYNASLYNAAMFGNSAEPGGALKTDAPFNPEQNEQLRSNWNQRHRGAAKAKNVAVLWGGMEWQSIASTMAEMQFVDGKQMSREEICAAYRVPPTVAGFFGRSGDSSAYTDNELKRFWQDTEAPLLDKIVEGVNVHLAGRFTGGLEAWADVEDVPIFQEMRRSQITVVKDLHTLSVPMADLNDWADLGLPERPWYETGFLAVNLLPADQAAAGTALPPIPERPSDEDADSLDQTTEGTEITESKQKKTSASSAISAVNKALADSIWQAWQRSWAPLAKRCAAMLANHYAAQNRKIVKLLKELLTTENTEGTESNNDKTSVTSPRDGEQPPVVKSDAIIARILVEVFEDAGEKLKFQVRMNRFGADANELGLRQSLTEAGLTGETLETTLDGVLHDPRIIESVRSDSIRISTLINDSTRNHVRRHLISGMEAGETTLQLADRVQEFMGGRRDAALTTARNTVGQALSRARREGRVASGVFTHEIWMHSRGPGERREAHVAAETRYAAEPKPIGQPFIVNGTALAYPRDPNGPPGEIVNCQCIAIGKRIKKSTNYTNDTNGKNNREEGSDSSNSCNSWTEFVTYSEMLRDRDAAFDPAQAREE